MQIGFIGAFLLIALGVAATLALHWLLGARAERRRLVFKTETCSMPCCQPQTVVFDAEGRYVGIAEVIRQVDEAGGAEHQFNIVSRQMFLAVGKEYGNLIGDPRWPNLPPHVAAQRLTFAALASVLPDDLRGELERRRLGGQGE